MAVSKSKRAAINRWDAEHMTVLGCKIRKDEAELFKALCKEAETTPSEVFRVAIAAFSSQVFGVQVLRNVPSTLSASEATVDEEWAVRENIWNDYIGSLRIRVPAVEWSKYVHDQRRNTGTSGGDSAPEEDAKE